MFSKKLILIQVLFLVAAFSLAVFYHRLHVAHLGMYGKVNDFKLTNSDNVKVGLKTLEGKIWVADFFFTTCASICPMMSAHMEHLQQVFKSYTEVRLVSFSVNPEQDTPEVLKDYSKKYHADSKRWFFLTGSREDITKVVVNSFKMGDIHEPIFHSSYFALVDKQGMIRGYYDSAAVKNIDKLESDLKLLRLE